MARFFISPAGSNSNNGKTRDAAWETMQFAHDSISDGDIIEMLAGTYTDINMDVTISKNNITVLGPNAYISAFSDKDKRIDEAIISGNTITNIFYITGENFELNGIKLVGVGDVAIKAENTTGIKLKNNICENSIKQNSFTFTNVTYAEIDNNYIYNCEHGIILSEKCDYSNISYNYCKEIGDNWDSAITVSTNSADCNYVKIHNNIIYDLRGMPGIGIVLSGSNGSGGKIANCEIYNNIIEDKAPIDNTSFGIGFLYYVSDISCHNNTIKDIYYGIYSTYPLFNSCITENEIIDTQAAMLLEHSSNPTTESGELVVSNNKIKSDVSSFMWNWGILYIGGAEDVDVKIVGNEITGYGGMVGTNPAPVFGGAYIGGSYCCITVYGSKLRNIEIKNNILDLTNTISAPTAKLGYTAYVDIDYPRCTGIEIMENSGDDGQLSSFFNLDASNNTVKSALDDAGVHIFDYINKKWGNLPSGVTCNILGSNFNNCLYGIRAGSSGEYCNAIASNWGGGEKPAGEIQDPNTGLVANGNGSIVSSGVLFDPYDNTKYSHSSIVGYNPYEIKKTAIS